MKTKPFNLDEAKRTLRAVTRDGEQVRLFAFDLGTNNDIAGARMTEFGETLTGWYSNGRFYTDRDSDLDLFTPVETVTRYLNIYARSNGGEPYPGAGFFDTREEAVAKAGASVLATVEIKFELP
jgi:hypothetical protein